MSPIGRPLLEREADVGTLVSLLDASAGGTGRLSIVEGPAGIGKTELLAAARDIAAERGLQVFWARGSDLEGEFTFGVVRQLFERSVASAAAERRSLLGGAASHAAPLFASSRWEDERAVPPPSLTAVLHGLFWLVANFSERGPVLLAIDDVQWADLTSLRFLHYLGRRLEEVPVVIVLALKAVGPAEQAELIRRIAVEGAASMVRLQPLTRVASRQLLGSLLAAEPDDPFIEACYAATGGNPLLLHELARALGEANVSPVADEAHRAGRLVPEALIQHVLIRLSRLPPSATALARAAAVVGGDEFGHTAALAGLDEEAAAEALDGLVAVDILNRGPPLQFVHPLLREVVYSDFPPRERSVAHRRAARVLADRRADPERIASQLLLCDSVGDAWVVEALRAAAREAHARGATRSAVTYLSRALAEGPPRELRASVLHELGLAETNEALSEASDHLAEALRLIPGPVERAAIAPELAVALEYRGRAGEAAAVLERSIEELGEGSPELRLRLEAHAVIATNTFLPSWDALRQRVSGVSARLSGAHEQHAAPLLSALALDTAYRGGSAREAVDYAHRGLAQGQGSSWLGGAVERIVAAEALMLCDRQSEAQVICDQLIIAAQAAGATAVQGSALTLRTHVLNLKGQIFDAEADARLALELAADEPFDFLRPYKLSQLVDALIERGELPEASSLLMPMEIARHEGDRTIFQLILRDLNARLLRSQGRSTEALAELAIVASATRDWDIRNPGLFRWRETSALLHHQLGENDPAVGIAEEELLAARRFGAPRALGVALRTAALVDRGDGVEQLQEAVAVLEASEARLEHARTLVELGAALRRAGHRADAREPLQVGLEVADECGARPLTEQAFQELLATGTRPGRRRSRAPDPLTPSERRVAMMAAEGLSNREIAQTLYLSLKTVEMHLSRTYRKLDIGSRTQLKDALAPVSQPALG